LNQIRRGRKGHGGGLQGERRQGHGELTTQANCFGGVVSPPERQRRSYGHWGDVFLWHTGLHTNKHSAQA
jgi:hypothetical protein